MAINPLPLSSPGQQPRQWGQWHTQCSPSFLPAVATNQALQCELENFSNETLYGCLIGVNNRGLSVAAILRPDLKLLQGKEQLTWPSPEDPLWIIGGDKAIAHWFLILSRFPLAGTATALGQQITGNNSIDPPSLESHPPGCCH
ncbi:hypothetical protein NON20_19975 [Synechocystis sp. B12]|nr:hypothetical protein NON20_19975 [Synechocystis sp. B12]